jgi:hypothetical protein
MGNLINQNQNPKIVSCYIKVLHYENGVIYTKQKVCSVLSVDQHENVTVKYYNGDTKEYEIRVLHKDQYSTTPFLMDFD